MIPKERVIASEVSRDIAMGLLFSGLVDDFRNDKVVEFCNQLAEYLLKKYTIEPKP